MACDTFFERLNRIDQGVPTQTFKNSEVANRPHQLVGTDIWIREQEEKSFLEGVTKIEFREGEISFHTILGEEIKVRAEIKRGLLLEREFIFELEQSPIL